MASYDKLRTQFCIILVLEGRTYFTVLLAVGGPWVCRDYSPLNTVKLRAGRHSDLLSLSDTYVIISQFNPEILSNKTVALETCAFLIWNCNLQSRMLEFIQNVLYLWCKFKTAVQCSAHRWAVIRHKCQREMKHLFNKHWQGPSIAVMWYGDTGRQNPARYAASCSARQRLSFSVYSHWLYCCGYVLYYYFTDGHVLLGNAFYTCVSKDSVLWEILELSHILKDIMWYALRFNQKSAIIWTS